MPKYQKRKDGRFQAKVWDGTFENGKKHYKYLFSTKSSRDLELKVIEYEANRLNVYSHIIEEKENVTEAIENALKF